MIRTRYRLSLFILISAVVVGGLVMLFVQGNDSDINAFGVNEYQYYIENFPSSENIGEVLNTKELLEKVEIIWNETYGESVKRERPYQVFYDEKNRIWLVQGTLPSNMVGGVAGILIDDRSGEVLAVWHEK